MSIKLNSTQLEFLDMYWTKTLLNSTQMTLNCQLSFRFYTCLKTPSEFNWVFRHVRGLTWLTFYQMSWWKIMICKSKSHAATHKKLNRDVTVVKITCWFSARPIISTCNHFQVSIKIGALHQKMQANYVRCLSFDIKFSESCLEIMICTNS
jgi:hypothetical protein